MAMGMHIYCLRREMNLSKKQLAKSLGVSRHTITQWEENQITPDMDFLVQLSELLNVSVDVFLTGEHIKNYKPSAFKRSLRWLINNRFYSGYFFILWGIKDFIQLAISGVLFFRFDNIFESGGKEALKHMNTYFESFQMDAINLSNHMNLDSFVNDASFSMKFLQNKVFMPIILLCALYFVLKLTIGVYLLKRRKKAKVL
jgi:transcriptional regulator with XRE-family HTH domain